MKSIKYEFKGKRASVSVHCGYLFSECFKCRASINSTLTMGLLAAIAVNVVGGAVIYGTGGLLAPFVAPMLGFGGAGIAAGSTAAAAQAYYGNVVAGSIISQLTAAAMVAPTP